MPDLGPQLPPKVSFVSVFSVPDTGTGTGAAKCLLNGQNSPGALPLHPQVTLSLWLTCEALVVMSDCTLLSPVSGLSPSARAQNPVPFTERWTLRHHWFFTPRLLIISLSKVELLTVRQGQVGEQTTGPGGCGVAGDPAEGQRGLQ